MHASNQLRGVGLAAARREQRAQACRCAQHAGRARRPPRRVELQAAGQETSRRPTQGGRRPPAVLRGARRRTGSRAAGDWLSSACSARLAAPPPPGHNLSSNLIKLSLYGPFENPRTGQSYRRGSLQVRRRASPSAAAAAAAAKYSSRCMQREEYDRYAALPPLRRQQCRSPSRQRRTGRGNDSGAGSTHADPPQKSFRLLSALMPQLPEELPALVCTHAAPAA